MATISLIKPLDQPAGSRRLLGDLRTALTDPAFSSLRLIVAYAKSGPVYRLQDDIKSWRKEGNTIDAIFGIDQAGTSYDFLDLALDLFDKVYVAQESGITFHPKLYLFKGENSARLFLGSNNLTVGGTETNFEAAICVDVSLPEDADILQPFEDAWTDLLPDNCPATYPLDKKKLEDLFASGVVLSERAMQKTANISKGKTPRLSRSGLVVKPQSPLPRNVLANPKESKGATASHKPKLKRSAAAKGFAIQIKPHHNGEIFLSVTAALQNPSFFKWPFNGATTPKKAGNPSYPQRDPDPVVNIIVFGASSSPISTLSGYPLNTVYYEKKSEIRITASPLVTIVPEYSIMIMEISEDSDIDYEITIHTPESPDYSDWLAVCNQKMPGGGSVARRYGWF